MKIFLLSIIRFYWIIFPKNKRRPCVFEESCSNHVYRIANEKGFFKGIQAFIKRFYQCRPGYELFHDEQSGSFELYLKDGSIVANDNISKTLLPPINYNYIIKK